MAIWALRCASADRLDFFPADIVRTQEGKIEIRGGNIRTYAPEDVWIIKNAHLDEVRGLVRETEAALRRLPRANDIAFAVARDAISVDMTNRAMALLKHAAVHGKIYDFGV